MRIVDQQRQLRERGRIRLGYSTPTKDGNKRPHKLKHFRFTAPDEATIAQVASIYGGTPEPWPDGGRDRFQVVTEADRIPVVYTSQFGGISQSYEMWARGFCTRRCDTVTCWSPGRKGMEPQPCPCDPDERECKLTTQLAVIAPELAGLGTWRLVTHGWYAGVELTTAIDLIEAALGAGVRIDAVLGLEVREVRRLLDGKPVVRKFAVPTFDIVTSVAALGRGAAAGGAALGLPAAPPAAGSAAPGLPAEVTSPGITFPPSSPPEGWQPVDQAALPPAPPFASVADQLAQVETPPPRRANAAPLIPPTGLEPRTVAEAEADAPHCSICGEPYGNDRLVRNPEPGSSRFVHVECLKAQGDETDQEGAPEPDQPPAPAEAEPATAQPAPPAEGARDGSGTASGEATAGPAPVTDPSPTPPRRYVRPASPAQMRKMMAQCAQVWPAEPGQSATEVDEERRANLLALCDAVGAPGLTSRTEISFALAQVVLDALNALEEGRVVLANGLLYDAETGERLAEGPQR